MSRYIGWMTLAQVVAVTVACIAVSLVLKISGYPANEFVRWNPVAVELRDNGHWLLVFPVVWAIYAFVCEQVDKGLLSETLAAGIGVLFPLFILILLMYSICAPYSRPLLQGIQPKSQTGGYPSK